MKPIFLLASVLMLAAVIGHEKGNFTEDEAETEPPINDNGKPVRKREAVACGATKVIITHVKREESGFNDEGNLDDSDEELPNLDKILGGNYATYGEFPWMAAILYYNVQGCGGAIISEFWVISAAHCVIGQKTDVITIAVGDHSLWNVDSHQQNHAVADIIIHELYSKGHFGNDIALVKIKPTSDGRGIRFNDYVQPICLPDSTENITSGIEMQFSGWGRTETGSRRPTLLKKTILPVVMDASCKSIFGNVFKSTDFCAGYINGQTDLCLGDSGGPAAYKSNGKYTLYGVAAASTGCPLPNHPAIFTSVPAFRGWIDTNSRRHG